MRREKGRKILEQIKAEYLLKLLKNNLYIYPESSNKQKTPSGLNTNSKFIPCENARKGNQETPREHLEKMMHHLQGDPIRSIAIFLSRNNRDRRHSKTTTQRARGGEMAG